MRELDDFLRFILPYAPSCPIPMAQQHLRAAAREFCEATRCWREVDCIAVTGDEIEVICVPPYATLHEIEAASFDGEPLERVSFSNARFAESGSPRQITQSQPNAISLAPKGAGALRISMFLKPGQDADAIPDFLYDQWAEDIGNGALARILNLPEQPFTNPAAAATYRALFERAKASNFNASMRGQQRAPVRTRPKFL